MSVEHEGRNVHNAVPVLLAVAIVGFATGCSTARQVNQLTLRSLKQQISYVQETDAALTTQPNPDLGSTASVFISSKTFNDALALLNNTTIAIPQIKDATMTIESAKVDFQDGLPMLDCAASADKAHARLHVNLRVLAQLQPIIDPNQERLTLNVLVQDVVPDAKWGIFRLRFGWFVRQLLRAQLQKLIDQKLHLEMPIATSLDLHSAAAVQSVTVGAPSGTVTGDVSLPGLTFHRRVSVTRILVLHDGLRIYLKATETD